MKSEQMDTLLAIADRYVTVLEKRFREEYPFAEKEVADAEVYTVGEGPEKLPETKEEYEDFPEGQPGRYERLLNAQKTAAQGSTE